MASYWYSYSCSHSQLARITIHPIKHRLRPRAQQQHLLLVRQLLRRIPQAVKKAIVVYFSGSGNTKRVAELVANETGSELFELVPTTPYTDDDLNWRDENSRVQKEHNDPSLQNIELTSTAVPDWESYDTVLFGYPLWWREAAWPVNNFVKGNDFSGKTVIPFCTSTSDGIGDSGSKLAQMAGTGTWQEGMRFSEREEESAAKEGHRVEGLNNYYLDIPLLTMLYYFQ